MTTGTSTTTSTTTSTSTGTGRSSGLAVGMITVDAQDARALASWWARQTGGREVADHDGEFLVVATAAPGPRLGFQRVDDPTPGKNRVHLDLVADDREAEVERLQDDGAAFVARHESGDFTWVVLADPEGNQLCVSGSH